MPSTQKKLTLSAKAPKLAELGSSRSDQTNMADQPPMLLGKTEIDNLVERITTEVLRGVETSLDKKIDRVVQTLDSCSSKLGRLDTRFLEMEGRVSSAEDNMTTHGSRITELENKLESALEKMDDLENRNRRCNVWIIGLPEGSESSNPTTFFPVLVA